MLTDEQKQRVKIIEAEKKMSDMLQLSLTKEEAAFFSNNVDKCECKHYKFLHVYIEQGAIQKCRICNLFCDLGCNKVKENCESRGTFTHAFKMPITDFTMEFEQGSPVDLDEEDNASMQKLIAETCDEVKALLLKKNKDYGSSFAFPIGVFAKNLDAEAQIRVRIDDKLNRLKTGINEISEDTEMDLIGYLILLRVLRKIK